MIPDFVTAGVSFMGGLAGVILMQPQISRIDTKLNALEKNVNRMFERVFK